ncbi:indole-3-glycerol-phosphate synthase [Microcystis aeruginosa FBCC-A68]|uniref:indole-3-glycerol-phosphate synthase n=1 Tax=Microcystis aeruginosa TaxID=1126 RepID=UPI0020161CFB|nr:indole-3-glycerol-phosphate synthase [Microcystis aeruginosa]
MGCGVWGVGCGVWGVGVVGNLAEISLNPHLPKSLSRSLPTPEKENFTIKITAVL